MNEFFQNQQFLINSMLSAISERDEKPRLSAPNDEELDAMYSDEKDQTPSEAYRLSH